jgi:hypothetical protein
MEQRNFGDRFKWIGVDSKFIVKELELTDEGWMVTECGPRCGYSIGDIWFKQSEQIGLGPERWKFIGNFGKSSRFREIYNILNNE